MPESSQQRFSKTQSLCPKVYRIIVTSMVPMIQWFLLSPATTRWVNHSWVKQTSTIFLSASRYSQWICKKLQNRSPSIISFFAEDVGYRIFYHITYIIVISHNYILFEGSFFIGMSGSPWLCFLLVMSCGFFVRSLQLLWLVVWRTFNCGKPYRFNCAWPT